MSLSNDTWAIIGILFTIFIALIFFVIGLRVGKPKLMAQGSSSGMTGIPNKDVMVTSLSISNLPTFWGMRMNRGPAQLESARLYDPSLKEYVGPILLWVVEGTQELSQKCTIQAGKQGQLCVFAKERYTKDYFIPTGKSLTCELNRPTVTFDELKKDFSVHLRDVIGHEYKFDIIVRNNDQSIGVGYKMTMHTRLRHIKNAFISLRRAFSIS